MSASNWTGTAAATGIPGHYRLISSDSQEIREGDAAAAPGAGEIMLFTGLVGGDIVSGGVVTVLAGDYSMTMPSGTQFAWNSVLEDDFTGADGNPPNPASWTVFDGGGGGSATIQSNALRLQVLGSDPASERGVAATGMPAESETIRVEGDVVIPAAGNRFFNSYHVRHNTTTDDHYYVMIARSPAGGIPFLRVEKSIGGSLTTLSSSDFTLSDAITHYRFRMQISNGFMIRGAARDFATGPIPEDSWDITADDNVAQSIPGVGIAQINATNLSGEGTDNVVLDNIVISVLVPV